MRRTNKVNLYGLIEDIITLYEKENLSFYEIEDYLKKQGYDISKSSIHKAYKTYKEAAKAYSQKFDEIQLLLTSLKDKPTTEMMEAISAIIARHLLEFVKDIDSISFDNAEELAKVAKTVSDMSDKLQKIREEKLKKAVENIEKQAKDKGIDLEFINYVKKEIYG
ncbi:MAG: hypothetical protein KatS3mg068_2473 [Candidatus Sericytochromatia bacterium]|nr:MAG: hypothetical protein KatS3mg068_1592 [Candidatus Sericytochromatia bacterium]GIW23466.1 MAG: hypothetical protein KatS3mg068_2473 [Candidatus Sericytochromatia bacterium]